MSLRIAIVLTIAGFGLRAAAQDGADASAPTVFLDKSPAVVKYQLKRLSNEQLLALQRNTRDSKYRPVYEAIVVRRGIARDSRHQALRALVRLNGSDVVTELLAALGAVDADDPVTTRELTAMLLGLEAAELAAVEEKLCTAVEGSSEVVRRAAWGALVIATGAPAKVCQAASQRPDGARLLLEVLPSIGNPALRSELHPFAEPLARRATDPAVRTAALAALGAIPARAPQSFEALATAVENGDGPVRDAAVAAMRRLPMDSWPRPRVGELARVIVRIVTQMPPADRTSPGAIEAVQLGNELAGVLAAEDGAPIRKALRELGVRVVLLRTIPEQMLYDVRYFVVPATKPVQIVFENSDVMPHNVVIGEPGSLQEIGLAAATMAPPTDPAVKAYVPDSTKVLHATHMLQPGQSATLSFDAPPRPGEYIFVCTYPGHFLRMYGVMLVVEDIEAWESAPQAPVDPLTGERFASLRSEPPAAGETHHEH